MGMPKFDDQQVMHYIDIVVEHFDEKFDALAEAFQLGFSELQAPKVDKKDVEGLKADITVIKAAVTDTNKDVRNHEKRITKLETKVFHA